MSLYLREARKSIGISQEDLAELVGVTRQTVSKWESEECFPQTEKLVSISQALNVSIDYLLTGKKTNTNALVNNIANHIYIKTFDGKNIVRCIRVSSSPIFKPTKSEPSYILNGITSEGLFGPRSTVLAFYDSEENIVKEIEKITAIMLRGEYSYELKYYAKVNMKGLSPKLIK